MADLDDLTLGLAAGIFVTGMSISLYPLAKGYWKLWNTQRAIAKNQKNLKTALDNNDSKSYVKFLNESYRLFEDQVNSIDISDLMDTCFKWDNPESKKMYELIVGLLLEGDRIFPISEGFSLTAIWEYNDSMFNENAMYRANPLRFLIQQNREGAYSALVEIRDNLHKKRLLNLVDIHPNGIIPLGHDQILKIMPYIELVDGNLQERLAVARTRYLNKEY